MLESLHLKNVGPAPEMRMDLAQRLNLITGDNGFGKSFLLDIAWWALTRHWPAEVNPTLAAGMMARPRKGRAKATIEFAFTGKRKRERYESTFHAHAQAWTGRAGRPSNPGLVLYAQVDGSFAVWDPARNYWKKSNGADVQERPSAYVFGPKEVWDGLDRDRTSLCNGLIRDWATWQKERGEAFTQLKAVLEALSPAEGERLTPGALTRISLDDVRDMPTIHMAYGLDVPVVHASAGIRRVAALAYLLVWTWQEHVRASDILHTQTTKQVVFLIDEIEAHLHPRWQRSVVSALLAVMNRLAAQARVQLVAVTQSPLVLASVEPAFDPAMDAWFDLDLERKDGQNKVVLTHREWTRHGDATSWLTSEAFDLPSGRSIEAEHALEEASRALSDEGFNKTMARKLDAELRKVLGDTDPFWMRWRFVGERRGWLA